MEIAYNIDQLSRPNTPFSRSKLYEEIAAGRLKARKLGRRTVILAKDYEIWLFALPTTGQSSPEGEIPVRHLASDTTGAL